MLMEMEKTPSSEQLLATTPIDIRAEAEEMLSRPDLCDVILRDIATMGIAGEQLLALTLYMVGTSRISDKPLAAIVRGPSASGKSYLIDKVASLFPVESVKMSTDMTANALYYMPPGSMKNAFVVAGERNRKHNDDSASATKALREMLSSGKLSKAVPQTNALTGEMETRLIQQEGPIAYVESTSTNELFEEDANRCLLLHTDDSSQQTRRINASLAERRLGRVNNLDAERRRFVHQTAQRLLQPCIVNIPFARELFQAFPQDRLESRRAFPQVLGMVEAVTTLFQFQRAKNPDASIEATPSDYEIARRLLEQPTQASLAGALPEGILRFHRELSERREREFTAPQIAKELRMSERTVREYLKTLLHQGGVVLLEEGRGPVASRWIVREGVDLSAGFERILPTTEELFGQSAETANAAFADLKEIPF